MALKGLQSWSVKEAGAPVTRAEILTATSATAVSTSGPTRALMGVVVPTNTEDLTLTMADGNTLVLPPLNVSPEVAADVAPVKVLASNCPIVCTDHEGPAS